MAIIGVLAFVIALLISVMIHEAGHYLTAKRFGMKVTEFFLGFGQKIWSFRRGETEFGLKAIPAGGYCRIVGMTPNEQLSEQDADRAFIKASVPQRLIVLGAGSFLHFVIGFVLLFVLFSTVGVTSLTNQVEQVSQCIPQATSQPCTASSTPSPAKSAGILPGDKIVKVNSVAYKEKPEIGTFMEEWLSLYKSKSGERGIFNREAAKKTVAKLGDRRDPNHEWGTNPCSEILLRDREFCNLSTVMVRPEDTQDSIARKIRLASILGTWQASLTHFPYLSSQWVKNCEEEALLGVSLTGILDNPLMGMKDHKLLSAVLEDLKAVAIATNKEWAEKIGINQAAAITCVKPEGTTSQLTDTASGIHARHNEYYIRTVRADRKDPLCQMMMDLGFPHEPCVMKPDHTMVFSFPQKAEGSITRNDMSAIEHLELWLTYQRYWCEHKPSITITVREHEWMEVGAWVYKHFDEVSGISFLPHSDHSYRQAPYQDCTKEEYMIALEKMPKNIDWTLLQNYEKTDTTSSSQTFACSANGCELVDIIS